jgi:hypothetical protein
MIRRVMTVLAVALVVSTGAFAQTEAKGVALMLANELNAIMLTECPLPVEGEGLVPWCFEVEYDVRFGMTMLDMVVPYVAGRSMAWMLPWSVYDEPIPDLPPPSGDEDIAAFREFYTKTGREAFSLMLTPAYTARGGTVVWVFRTPSMDEFVTP